MSVDLAIGGVAILPQQQHLRIRTGEIAEHGQDRARTWVPQYLELADRAVGIANLVDVEVDHPSRINPLARDLCVARRQSSSPRSL